MSAKRKSSTKGRKPSPKLSDCCKSLREKLGGDTSCYSHKTACNQNKSSFSIENPKKEEICRIDLDECVMKDGLGIRKCDFVFVRCKNKEFFFVELKDDKMKVAFKQITSSIEHFQQKEVVEKKLKWMNTGVIICSRVRPQHNTLQTNLKKEFAKKWGRRLIIKSQSYSHKLEDA